MDELQRTDVDDENTSGQGTFYEEGWPALMGSTRERKDDFVISHLLK